MLGTFYGNHYTDDKVIMSQYKILGIRVGFLGRVNLKKVQNSAFFPLTFENFFPTPCFKKYISESPTKIKISPCRYEVDTTLSVELRVVKDWLGNLPDTVVEEVVSSTLFNLEARLLVDKDKKLILTLINIETIKMNDFFFGIHSLLNILRGFCITNLNISKR